MTNRAGLVGPIKRFPITCRSANRRAANASRWGCVCLLLLCFWTQPVLAGERSATDAPGLPRENTEEPSNATWMSVQLMRVPENTVALGVVYPRQFWMSPAVGAIPMEFLAHDAAMHYGIDFREVRCALVLLTIDDDHQLTWSCALFLNRPFEVRELPAGLLQDTELGMWQGRPYRRGRTAAHQGLLLIDQQTLLIATDRTLEQMSLSPESSSYRSELAAALAGGLSKALDVHLVVDLLRLQPAIDALAAQPRAQGDLWPAAQRFVAHGNQLELRGRFIDQCAFGVVVQGHEVESGSTLNDAWLQIVDVLAAMDHSLRVMGDSDFARVPHDAGAATANHASATDTIASSQLWQSYVARLARREETVSQAQAKGSQFSWSYRGGRAEQITVCAAVAILYRPVSQAAVRWFSSARPN